MQAASGAPTIPTDMLGIPKIDTINMIVFEVSVLVEVHDLSGVVWGGAE